MNRWKELFEIEYTKKEIEKCISNPYYFATKYLTVAGEPFTTRLTEEDFNDRFKNLSNGNYHKSRR